MAITRRGESNLALHFELVDGLGRNERRKERAWLAVASLLVGLGLLLVLLAKTQEFPESAKRLDAGQLINLNGSSPSQTSSSILAMLTTAGDREVARQQVTSFLERSRPLRNVGALNRLHGADFSLSVSRIKPRLVVRTPAEFYREFACWAAAYLAAFWLVHAIWCARKFRGDAAILPALHLCTGVGLILMVSLRDPLRDTLEFRKFAFGVMAGCTLLLLPLLKVFRYRHFSRFTYTPLFGALGLFLALLFLGSGPTGSDARVNLGPVQPVEAIKILLVFFLAGYFARNWNHLRDLQERRFVPGWLSWLELPRISSALPVIYAVACSLILFFVLKDMGPALVTGFLFLTMFAVARRRVGLAALGVTLLVSGVSLGYHFGTPHTVVDRVSMWLSPWDNNVRGGDQLAHSLWAFATGGPWGSGPGWGDPAVIPAGHTDLVLPALAEEWGFPGVLSVCLLFALLVIRAYRIALRAPDEYGMFLATGLGSLLAFEMLLVSAGALGVIPLSGVVSPFLSSGNTAMLANFFACALLLGISNQSAQAMEFPSGEDAAAPRFQTLFGRPLEWLSLSLALCAGALLSKAASLEIWHDDELLAKDALVYTADGVKRPQHNPRLNLLAAMIPRGAIYDRNGVLLATSSWDALGAQRSVYEDLAVAEDRLGSPTDTRYYPFGTATVQLLGDWRTGERFHATNASLIEHDSNAKLQGYRNYQELASVVRYRHQLANPALRSLLERNRDVRSTIDIRMQLRAIEVLRAHCERTRQRASVLIMNAESGDILALANWPLPSERPAPEELLDRARYGQYPPGSTFKLVTAAAALRLDPEARGRQFQCKRLPDGRAGTEIVGWRRPIRDDIGDHVHGSLTMERALAVSCNAYFAQLGVRAVGAKGLYTTAKDFGIDAGTESQIRQTLPFTAYGQGMVVATPFKMARVAAAIAADGAMPQGRWVLDGSDGRTTPPANVLSSSAAAFLQTAMRSTVTSGTARSQMTGVSIPIAGKTGTAQLDRGQPHAWFVGFAPYQAPRQNRLAFAVIVEHGGYGAKAAAPIARELVEAADALGLFKERGKLAER